jgi:hypothetical protein
MQNHITDYLDYIYTCREMTNKENLSSGSVFRVSKIITTFSPVFLYIFSSGYNCVETREDYTAKTQYRIFETNIREKELRGHSPNSFIPVSVSELYIPMISLPILLQENTCRRTDHVNI